MRKDSNHLKTVLKDPPLMAAGVALVFAIAASGMWGQDDKKPAPPVDSFQIQPVRAVLKEAPKAQIVPNSANCGPRETFRNVMFLCVSDRPLGVQVNNVVLRFSDDRGQPVDEICTSSSCRPVDQFAEDERAGFNWWKAQAFQHR